MPFGAIGDPATGEVQSRLGSRRPRKKTTKSAAKKKSTTRKRDGDAAPEARPERSKEVRAEPAEAVRSESRTENRPGPGQQERAPRKDADPRSDGATRDGPRGQDAERRGRRSRRRGRRQEGDVADRPASRNGTASDGSGPAEDGPRSSTVADDRRQTEGRSRRRRRGRRDRGDRGDRGDRPERPDRGGHGAQGAQQGSRSRGAAPASGEVEGMFMVSKKGGGTLRDLERQYLPSPKHDVAVPLRMVQRHKLRAGAIVKGRFQAGGGKRQLVEILEIDGRNPREAAGVPTFKNLTSIDPDFHYMLGDSTREVSMRIVDVLCPIGRGTRGLIVAPPRSGKTILMQQIAKGMETTYPDVHLMVLLVDERPEEATEWRRTTSGQVFVSTNDEAQENHVQLAEAVWARCQRLVELGEDVVLLLDSITRLARAYNNVAGGTGRTLSGGLDTRAMERPKQFFGSARNTEKAGSLTILGTTLIETGSRMDQVIFEEFKGTGNMELVLSRKLADRRIFPALDVERSGTRKEEKLFGMQRLRRIQTLRRVLTRMHFIEAMELLITKLEDVEKTDDFLQRFEVDPDA